MSQFEAQNLHCSSMQAICTAIDETLSRLTATAPSSTEQELRVQWAQLVALLASEPTRTLRECPVCKQVGMLEATRCRHCWSKLAVATAEDAYTD